MKSINIVLCFVLGATMSIVAETFVRPKKASQADREACCQAYGAQIKACADLIESVAQLQRELLGHTASFLESEQCFLSTAGKNALQTQCGEAEKVTEAMRDLQHTIQEQYAKVKVKS